MNSLEMIIGSLPNAQKTGLSFSQEISLVKSGLLYADRLHLLSIVSFAFLHLYEKIKIVANKENKKAVRLKALNELVEVIHGKSLDNKKLCQAPTPQLEKHIETIISKGNELLGSHNWDEIALAYDANKVSLITPFKGRDKHAVAKQMFAEARKEAKPLLDFLFDVRIKEILDNDRFHPLFDDSVRVRVEQAHTLGLVKPSNKIVSNSRETGLAAFMFVELPTFPAASVTEVMQLREYLDRHLKAFRAATKKYSESIAHEQWSRDFEDEAKKVFSRDVMPAIDFLKETLSTDSALKNYLKHIKTAVHQSRGSLVLGVAGGLIWKNIISSLTMACAGVATDAAIDMAKEITQARKHGMYFYHRTSNLL